MEDNLIYKDNSIFTKIPHIYLNLNTTITENLNVDNITNLNTLNVDTYSTLRGQLISDNIYNNKNLIVNGTSTLNDTTNINNTLYLNHSEDSSNITSGSIITQGGIGIAKNAFIGGNTTVENNLNVFKSTNITENLNVLSVSTLYNLNVTTNTNLDTLYVSKDSVLKQLLTTDNIINNNDLIVHGTSTLHDDVTFNSKLNLNGTEDSSNSNTGVLVISGGIGIGKNVSISGNTTIENNLNVYKSTNITENLNVLGVSTLYNLNVTTNTNLDTLYVSKDAVLKQLLTTDNIINNQALTVHGDVSFNSKLNLNDTTDSSNSNTGTLVISGGVGIAKNVSISGNTIIENNLNVLKSTNITENLNVLSVSTLYNLNVTTNTNLDTLYVSKDAVLKQLLTTDNIINNQDLTVHGISTLHGDVIFNSKLSLDNTDDSSNSNTGVLIVKGGVGIAKNVSISGNTTIENNLNVYKSTNITENLNVLDTTVLNKLNVLNNVNIIQNLNVNESVTISKNLNILSNTITQQSNIVYKDIIGHNSLTVSKDSQFKSNLTVFGNFAVLGESFNIVSDKTFVADPLVVFGMNQAQTFDNSYGGFVINHINTQDNNNDVYSGIVRKPSSNDFYLLKNIKSIEDEINSTLRNPDLDTLSTHNQYGNFHVNNISINNTTSNTLINSGIGSFGSITSGIGTFNGLITAHSGIIGDLDGNATTSTTATNVLNIRNETDSSPNFITFLNHGTSNTSGVGQQIRTHTDLSFYPSNCQLYVGTSGGTEGTVNANEFRGDLIGSVITSSQTNITELGALTHLNVGESNSNQYGKITAKDLDITNNVSVSNDVKISGNLIVTGNSAIVITNHFDINDPIFTISNNSPHYDRGMLVNNGKLQESDPDLYSGLIRKDSDSNFYLLDNIDDPLAQTVPTTYKSTLILKNINTSYTSHLHGLKIVENDDTSNTSNLVATFPNNSTSEDIVFYKKTKFNEHLTINSNVNLNANLSVSDKFILLNTNTFISHGTTQLLGNTVITGKLDLTKSVINCDHINIKSFFNNLGNTRTKDLDADNIKIVDKLRFPIRDTISSANDADFPANKTGYVIFNKTRRIYEGFDGNNWIPLGLSPGQDSTETTINSNLNVTLNVNCDNNLIRHNLEVDKDATIEGDLTVKKYIEVTKNITSSATITNLLDVKQTSIFRNKMEVLNETSIHKNLNVYQNLNVADTITSNTNIVKHNLIIPTHDNNSNLLNPINGSIYYNTTNNLYYGYNQNSWLPLGGINPYIDTTIDHNLIVKKNINVEQNLNVAQNLNVSQNLNVADTITTDNNIVIQNFVVPNHDINSNTLDSINGSIYYNTTNNLYYGYNNDKWLPLGGINPLENTTINHNLIVKKNINVEQNLNVAQNLNVSQNLNVADTITTDNNIVIQNFVVPNHDINSNTLDSINGSIYYNTTNNLYYGYNNDKWLPLGGINPLEDTTIDHNLIVKKNINVEQNLNVAQNLTVSQNLNVSDTITTNNNIVLENLVVPKHNKDSNTINQVEGSIYYNTTDNLYYSRNNLTWLPLGGIHPNEDTIINHNLNIKKNLNIEQNLNVADTITSNNNIVLHNLVIPKHNTNSNTLNQVEGSIYYNTTDNLYYSRNNITWLPLGGINPNKDTIINHNLNIINKTQTNSLLVNGMSHFDGHVYVDNTLSSKQLIIPSNPVNKTVNDTGSLYINYNGAFSQLKLRLNDQDNIIPFNNNPIVQLNSSTDLFQFYNVHNNQPIFGNRITGLNDPAFNSFTKFYTLKEFTFFQETLLTDIEFYVSHNIHNNTTDLQIKIEIIKNSVNNPPILTQTFNNILVATVSFFELDTVNIDNKFEKDDKIKVKLTLLNSENTYNGHEIFVKLHGHAKIHPNVQKLQVLDETDIGNETPALLCMGGGEFKERIKAKSVSTFTGCHISTIITPSNYNTLYSYYSNNIYIFKPGLIVSVDNSTHINIDSSKFNIKLTDTITDKTVFGVINSYLGNQQYYINSLGEGAIWVSNINGDVQNGDYIMSSNISGYGCKQNDDILHSYTVAKCCSIINWNSINSYINYYSKQYKIAFVACTYHCG